ncbi:RluA family pseudouridine synthase [Synoicihabitans lomoniglobus]|uniref:RluA family pseudouridine synthase n=1 Tax=Synoicihabitans lomoniglobus TaxID=2909285 RepID=A0AAE9ZYD2_9BACT|nr:RluA family pseudouridine synthase [Opitutaceae bacterium LMO-M01]WED65305.1 RluA family pseudouridine synthase [Opitutaceae bacterium LMO-M01]
MKPESETPSKPPVYGPWAPRPFREDRVKLIDLEELKSWIIHEDDDLLVVNKSGEVVCHPSKFGPTSSLVGAAREYTGLPTMHLVFRLDRETSGVVVLAKNAAMASRLQTAMMTRKVGKRYLTILTGELTGDVTVDQPLGREYDSPVHVKDCVRADGKAAVSHFKPLLTQNGFTLAEVDLATGRKHQIRAHAQWLGHTVVGDKIYGPDPRLFLKFIDDGWTPELEAKLLLARQALHCAEIDLRPTGLDWVFRAPWPEDLAVFMQTHMPSANLPS